MDRIIVLFLAFNLASCDTRPNNWNAYVYPNGITQRAVILRGFVSHAACRDAAKEVIASLKTNQSAASYECGYKCKPYDGADDLDLCKETRDD